MKRKQKKILGLFGLLAVVGMTIIAASLPSPQALAAQSMTESIVVTVKPPANQADVNFTPPTPRSGTSFVKPNQTIAFNYYYVDDVLVTMEKEMPSGTPQVYNLFSDNSAGMQPGNGSVNINFGEAQYGYGKYTAKITGQGTSGTPDTDVVNFGFYPVIAWVEENETTGEVVALIEYDENNVDIDHFVLDVYDENGNRVDRVSPGKVSRDTTRVVLWTAEDRMPAGMYTIRIGAYDDADGLIYETYETVFLYESIFVPNTGGLFAGLNISRADYLATGLIVFFLVGLSGIIFTLKKSSKR